MNPIFLQPDMVRSTLDFLDPKDLISCAQVCKAWHKCSNVQGPWRRKYAPICLSKEHVCNWKQKMFDDRKRWKQLVFESTYPTSLSRWFYSFRWPIYACLFVLASAWNRYQDWTHGAVITLCSMFGTCPIILFPILVLREIEPRFPPQPPFVSLIHNRRLIPLLSTYRLPHMDLIVMFMCTILLLLLCGILPLWFAILDETLPFLPCVCFHLAILICFLLLLSLILLTAVLLPFFQHEEVTVWKEDDSVLFDLEKEHSVFVRVQRNRWRSGPKTIHKVTLVFTRNEVPRKCIVYNEPFDVSCDKWIPFPHIRLPIQDSLDWHLVVFLEDKAVFRTKIQMI